MMRHTLPGSNRFGWALGLAALTALLGGQGGLAIPQTDPSTVLATEATDLAATDLNDPGTILLQQGDRGPTVATLQRLLNTLGDPDLEDDGIYGQQTAVRIASLQRTYGQTPDGDQVTWQTWGLIWAEPWVGLYRSLPTAGLLTAAEQKAQTAEDGASPSPLWLILMPAIPLLGGALTYWKRRLWGVKTMPATPRSTLTPATKGWRSVVINYFPLLGLALVSTTAFGVYIFMRGQLTAPVKVDLETLATDQTTAVNTWFNQQRQGVLSVATAPDILPQIEQLVTATNRQTPEARAAYEAISTYLETLPEFGTASPDVSLLTNGGIVVLSSDASREGQYQPLQNTTTYFTQEQPNQVPNLYVSPLTGALQITFATPVVNTDGSRLGVIAIDLDFSNLQEQVSQVGRDENMPIVSRPSQQSYLVGRASRLRNQILSDDGELLAAYPEGVNSRGIREAIGGTSGTDLYLNYDKSPVIGVHRWLGQHNLALMVEVNQGEIFEPARQVTRQILIVGLVLTALISVLLRRFATPGTLTSESAPPPPLGDQQQSSPE
jgi:peptidoglycan hydrolase-like protein with peptidoglycan-binding domain